MKQGCSTYLINDISNTAVSQDSDNQTAMLSIETQALSPIAVEESKAPSWDRPWIGPLLKDTLFTVSSGDESTIHQSPNHQLKTYLLLDAAQVSALEGVFSLAKAEDLGVLCLLGGEARKDLKDYAPYLINLTLSQQQLEEGDIPSFHRDVFIRYWGKHCGIFLHSYADLNTVARHCKKFIKLKDEQDQWFFFRFYDPRVAQDYFRWMENDGVRIAKWFGIKQGKPLIQSLIFEADAGQSFTRIEAKNYEQLNDHSPIGLTKVELGWMQQSRWQRTKKAIYQSLQQELSEEPFLQSKLERQLVGGWCEEALRHDYTTERAIYDYAYSHALAHHFELDLAEVNDYLAAKDDSDVEKAKELQQILLNAINTYRMNQQEE
ncbi:DUF4123 domain-containing protein [Kangiella koreensis]|uniref:DUF4123 domain-containing protein n=1 Tax=Kangiella koreensis (strain DSM 16069 / JCM 12317 / KCTC 12182 / SW-125) TaxID=523791 RepID=C7RCW6_KANKD|nr:DUF4123 domain-containing protein [Kangiella koreensis]ACV27108.1 hypothetical protein Kkor_1696 [Kangiella koreensis DSM 16069]